MKNKIIYVRCAIMIFASIYEITYTYGLFESNKTKLVDNPIASWNILINNSNLNQNKTFTINNFQIDENTTVKNGRIAPGTTGYFDIEIDPSDTDVSIRYDITFDCSKLPSNLTVESIEETNGYTIVRTDAYTYSNIITLTNIKNGVKNNIRVHIKWQNVEEQNQNDTEIGLNKEYILNIPITITATQYFNETLQPYVEPELTEEE